MPPELHKLILYFVKFDIDNIFSFCDDTSITGGRKKFAVVYSKGVKQTIRLLAFM